MSSGDAAVHVNLVVKTPAAHEAPFRFSVPLDGTVRDIKEALTREHPEHPPAADQRLIFAGRLLLDPSGGPNWRLVSSRCSFVMQLPPFVHALSLGGPCGCAPPTFPFSLQYGVGPKGMNIVIDIDSER